MKKSIARDEWADLILLLAISLGAFLRFNPALLAGFAVNDGGMFAAMVDDLRANRYLIPAFTTYNHLNIPFAYPPLGFYFGAFAVDLFKINSIEVVRWMPAFFASLSIPAFYFLSLRLLRDKYYASLSTLFFALTPRAFFWFVMGGGVTRAPGQFFMLLALGAIVRLHRENRRADVVLAGIFGGLAVMSHPEAAAHTLLSAVFLWFMLSRTRVAFVRSILVALLALLLSAPWWGTVIRFHGIEPLLSAAQSGENPLAFLHLFFFTFTEEPYMTVIAVLALIGIARRIVRRDYLLPLWMAIPFVAAGRSATNLVVIPLAMLAAVGLAEVVLPALQASGREEAGQSVQVSSVERNVFLYLLIYMVFSAYQFGFQVSGAALSKPERDAMFWVKGNTPEEARFLVLSGANSVACDATSEWFPALTGRRSLFTIQGAEWTRGKAFKPFIREAVALQSCAGDDPSCIDRLLDASAYDYVYLSKVLRAENCAPLAPARTFAYFAARVRGDERYEAVYETDDVMIYRER